MLTEIKLNKLIEMIGINKNKYYDWNSRLEKPNNHNGQTPKSNWLLDWEKESIKDYAKNNSEQGYRRLTYMMIDDDVVAVSPSTTYRVLSDLGLLNKWNTTKTTSKGQGFTQPKRCHQHWHTDIKYVNFKGTFLFLISVIDGYSRYIIHHELRMSMQEFDVQLTIQRALEKFPDVKPRIISDNGSQFISKDFNNYIRIVGLQHIRTSIAYPQSNGKIERYHKTIKTECLQKQSFINLDDARNQIQKYVDYYNNKRLHSSLFYLTPIDFLNGSVEEKLKLRQNKLNQAKLNRMKTNYNHQTLN